MLENSLAHLSLGATRALFDTSKRGGIVQTSRPPLDIGRVVSGAAAITALLLLNTGGNPGAAVFFLVLLAMVLRDPVSAFKALAICYLGLMINQALVPKSLVWTPCRLALPLVALVRFSSDIWQGRGVLFSNIWYLAFVLYVMTMVVCSVLSGWYTTVALLKLFNFWSCLTAIFAGVVVIRSRRADTSEWFVSLILAAAGFGIASIALGQSTNFMRVRTGIDEFTTDLFNGAFLHPNCHSLYASLFVVFMASLYLLGPYRNRWILLPLIGLWLVFMVTSKSRTSIISTVLPLLVLVLYSRPRINRNSFRLRPNVRKSTIFGLMCLAVIGTGISDLSTGGSLRKSFVRFFNKSGEANSETLDSEQIIQSRRKLIEFSYRNFTESPVYGIGFQVAKTEFFQKNATLFSAPAEKGFLPTALLEEGGVLGASTFVILVLSLFNSWMRSGNAPAFITFFGFLVSNFGEVSIFSPGGSGAFGWIMVGAASILGDHCWRPPPINAWPQNAIAQPQ